MLDVFSLIFVTDTKIICRYDFVAPLIKIKITTSCGTLFERLQTRLLHHLCNHVFQSHRASTCHIHPNAKPNLKSLRNHNEKLFLCSPRNQVNTHSIILTTIFRTKFTSWPIKLNTYMLEIKFVSYKQYLFGRLFSIKAKKSRTDQISLQVFNLSELKRLNSFNSSSYKKSFFLVSMIQMQFASMNVFYSI